jgi:hypothetical protein
MTELGKCVKVDEGRRAGREKGRRGEREEQRD